MNCVYCNEPVKWVDARIIVIQGFKNVACKDPDVCYARVAEQERARRNAGE